MKDHARVGRDGARAGVCGAAGGDTIGEAVQKADLERRARVPFDAVHAAAVEEEPSRCRRVTEQRHVDGEWLRIPGGGDGRIVAETLQRRTRRMRSRPELGARLSPGRRPDIGHETTSKKITGAFIIQGRGTYKTE